MSSAASGSSWSSPNFASGRRGGRARGQRTGRARGAMLGWVTCWVVFGELGEGAGGCGWSRREEERLEGEVEEGRDVLLSLIAFVEATSLSLDTCALCRDHWPSPGTSCRARLIVLPLQVVGHGFDCCPRVTPASAPPFIMPSAVVTGGSRQALEKEKRQPSASPNLSGGSSLCGPESSGSDFAEASYVAEVWYRAAAQRSTGCGDVGGEGGRKRGSTERSEPMASPVEQAQFGGRAGSTRAYTQRHSECQLDPAVTQRVRSVDGSRREMSPRTVAQAPAFELAVAKTESADRLHA